MVRKMSEKLKKKDGKNHRKITIIFMLILVYFFKFFKKFKYSNMVKR